MKTYKNLYRDICSESRIKEILTKAVKGKPYCTKAMANMDDMARKLCDSLLSKRAPMAPTATKIIRDRKKDRTITISRFWPNKAFDYLLTEEIKPLVSKSMYRWCCGNVKGRGIDDALRKAKKEAGKYAYCLQIDIKKFYENIDKATLFRLVSKKISDNDFLTFYRQVVGCCGKGLPLGMPSSQWLSNFYLQGFDYFVKQELRAPSYIRYVDNIWLFGNNKRKLFYFLREIRKFLGVSLGLSVKENWQVYNLAKGEEIDVLGYKVGKRFARLAKPILYKLCRLFWRMKDGSVRRARTIASLLGWLKRTNGWKRFVFSRMEERIGMSVGQVIALAGRRLKNAA